MLVAPAWHAASRWVEFLLPRLVECSARPVWWDNSRAGCVVGHPCQELSHCFVPDSRLWGGVREQGELGVRVFPECLPSFWQSASLFS